LLQRRKGVLGFGEVTRLKGIAKCRKVSERV
jgi:hypothetical protein